MTIFDDKIIQVVLEHTKVIIKHKLDGIIVKLSPLAMEAVMNIALLHKPRTVHNVTFSGINICFGSPSGMPQWNSLIKYEMHHLLLATIMEHCKFDNMVCKVSYM